MFHIVLHIGSSRRIRIRKQINIDQSLPEVIFKIPMNGEKWSVFNKSVFV